MFKQKHFVQILTTTVLCLFYKQFFPVLRVNRTLVDSCLRNPGDPCAASLDPGRSHTRQVGCSASLAWQESLSSAMLFNSPGPFWCVCVSGSTVIYQYLSIPLIP
jgi:hypothetical protein